MAAISAAMVKELREMTGAGMMDCKKALTETDGNMDEAVEVLRKNGQAKMDKKAGRIAAEGLCKAVTKDGKTAVLVEVNSETDFVAKNEKFIAFVDEIAERVATSDVKDVEALLNEKSVADPSKTLNERLVELVSVIGEKLSVRRFEKVSADLLDTYIHGGGKIAVVVCAKTDVVNDDIKEALHNVSMQVAALSPRYVSVDEVPGDYVEHEKEILKAQIMNDPKESQKPEKVITGMIQGRINKQLKEICLNDQEYFRAEDGKQTVGQYIKEVGKANGANLSIAGFIRYETGEGMEKKEENFAEEVAKQING